MNDILLPNHKLANELYRMLLKIEELNNSLDDLFYYVNNEFNRNKIIHAISTRDGIKTDSSIKQEMKRAKNEGGIFIKYNRGSFKTISLSEYNKLLVSNATKISDEFQILQKIK